MASGGLLAGEARFLPKRPALLVSRATERGRSFALASLDGANDLEELTSERGYEGQAAPSPDGQWLAFATDRSGWLEVDHTRFVVVDDPDGTAQTFRVLTNWQGHAAR